MNRLQLDIAILKLQHDGVGRHLELSKTSIVFEEPGAKVNGHFLWREGFWLGVTASVQDVDVTSGRCSKTARRLPLPETLCNICN